MTKNCSQLELQKNKKKKKKGVFKESYFLRTALYLDLALHKLQKPTGLV